MRGRLLQTAFSDEEFQVNTARQVVFDWTIPAAGAEGCCIQAVAREKRADGTWYEPTETFSQPFTLAAVYEPKLVKCVQDGDSFAVEYTVTNTGNQAAPQGTMANLILEGLYGDLREKYGVEDELLITEDISGLAPGETRTVKKSITLPVSVFTFCGYDAVTVVVRNSYGETLECTDHNFITLDAPLNPELNSGKDMVLKAGETGTAVLKYDSTVFMDVSGKTSYSMADPAIASVDENGVVTGLSSGTTTLTATLLPSGRTAEIAVTVSGASSGGETEPPIPEIPETPEIPENPEIPEIPAVYEVSLRKPSGIGTVTVSTETAIAGQRVRFTPSPAEGYELGTVAVRDAGGNEIAVTDDGDGSYSFIVPAGGAVVEVSFIEKTPASAPETTFVDVPADTWYSDAVAWASAKGITNGTDATHFSPDAPCTRAQMVTFLWRAAGEPEPESAEMPFADLESGSYYEKAVRWAV